MRSCNYFRCCIKQSAPIECTHIDDVIVTSSSPRFTFQQFNGFSDIESYSGSSYMSIYSKSVSAISVGPFTNS
jgi:hypothetical protein